MRCLLSVGLSFAGMNEITGAPFTKRRMACQWVKVTTLMVGGCALP